MEHWAFHFYTPIKSRFSDFSRVYRNGTLGLKWVKDNLAILQINFPPFRIYLIFDYCVWNFCLSTSYGNIGFPLRGFGFNAFFEEYVI